MAHVVRTYDTYWPSHGSVATDTVPIIASLDPYGEKVGGYKGDKAF